VAEPIDPEAFIRAFLEQFLENQLVNGFLSIDEYHDFCAELRQRKLRAFSQRLFRSSPEPIQFGGYGPLRLIYLREYDGNKFPFLQGLTQKSPLPPELACFVGHRFLPGIESSLRYNLAHLFEPHAITLNWAGDDFSASDIFEGILRGIRHADLCLFDNLATANKPNVYIEIGIAYARGKPMLFCEHLDSGMEPAFEAGSVPSDLQGLLRIQYRNYEELCRKLYLGLPSFLERHKLR